MDLRTSTSAQCEAVFERMEATHGAVLVCWACGLISASKAGMSACELEDALSMVDEVQPLL